MNNKNITPYFKYKKFIFEIYEYFIKFFNILLKVNILFLFRNKIFRCANLKIGAITV